VSWPWIVLLVAAVVVVVAAEWARLGRAVGADARKTRERRKRKASLKLITNDPDSDEFAQSVQRDLDALPTIDEPRSKNR
jgi:Sec-independent protein translocase protein TatA